VAVAVRDTPVPSFASSYVAVSASPFATWRWPSAAIAGVGASGIRPAKIDESGAVSTRRTASPPGSLVERTGTVTSSAREGSALRSVSATRISISADAL
jgi:hypothetical protein